jgi:hypothetical protein
LQRCKKIGIIKLIFGGILALNGILRDKRRAAPVFNLLGRIIVVIEIVCDFKRRVAPVLAYYLHFSWDTISSR